jgi:predicted dienelactone hydrolase
MRPFELILLAGNLLALALLALPQSRRTRWPLLAAGAAMLVALAQVLIEGARWQMLPAYALAGLLLLAALVLRRPPGRRNHTAGRRLVTAAAIAAAVLVMAVSVALPMSVPMFQFPDPGGPYGIGTLTYHWTDPDRADFGDPAARREIMVQLWYPADPDAKGERDGYIQDEMRFGGLPGTSLPGFFSNHLKDVRTHAIRAAPVAAGTGRFTVLSFAPGAEGLRQHNTFEVEALVSRGYVVAAIDHPRAAREVVFPDGRRVEFDPNLVDVPRFLREPGSGDPVFDYLASDVSFALDQLAAIDRSDPDGVLTGRLDLDRTGMFGVSLGGLVAAEACRTDPRIRACIIMDVFVPQDVLATGLDRPTMILTRDADSMRAEGWPDWEIELHLGTMRQLYEGVRSDAYFVSIPGMFHVNYTDFPYTIAAPVARAMHLIGPIDFRRGHAIVNAWTLAFLDEYLRDEPGSLLDGPSDDYPEVSVEARHT